MGQTHLGFLGYLLLMPCHLPDRRLVKRKYPYEPTMLAFHYYLHVVDQRVDYIESLRNGRPRLLES